MKYTWVIFGPPAEKKDSTKIRNMAKEGNKSQSMWHKTRLLLRVFFFFKKKHFSQIQIREKNLRENRFVFIKYMDFHALKLKYCQKKLSGLKQKSNIPLSQKEVNCYVFK